MRSIILNAYPRRISGKGGRRISGEGASRNISHNTLFNIRRLECIPPLTRGRIRACARSCFVCLIDCFVCAEDVRNAVGKSCRDAEKVSCDTSTGRRRPYPPRLRVCWRSPRRRPESRHCNAVGREEGVGGYGDTPLRRNGVQRRSTAAWRRASFLSVDMDVRTTAQRRRKRRDKIRMRG